MTSNAQAEELPLLDEVNELIQKERTLLNLKLLEQKQETDEWRQKYDNLVGKVSDKVHEDTFDFNTLEQAANILSEKQAQNTATLEDINLVIASQRNPWILDLSNIGVEENAFTTFCKSAFSSRTSNSGWKAVILRNCGLSDGSTAALLSIFRNSQVVAIDISHNQLSEMFFLQLLPVLKVGTMTIFKSDLD